MDGINQYAWISIMAFLYEIPLAIYFEGALWPAAWQAACNSLGGVGEMVKVRRPFCPSFFVLSLLLLGD